MKLSRLAQIGKTAGSMYLSKMGVRMLPYSLFWYITWRCNSRCLHCGFGKNEAEMKADELPFERVKEIINEAAGWGARHIAFAGGEAFLRDDFLSIIRHCKAKGFVVGVSTNGYLLARPEFAREVVATGVDRLDISLDAPDALHDRLRGVPGAFESVNAAIDNLLVLKKNANCYVGVNTVVSGFNLDRLTGIFEYAKKKGIDGVGLQPFHQEQARAKELIPQFLLNGEQVVQLKQTLKEIIHKYGDLLKNSPFFVKNVATFYEDNSMPGYACYGGLQEIHLFPDGTTGVCCFNRDSQSVKDRSLREIFDSPSFRETVKKAALKKCPGCWSPPVHEYNILFNPLEIVSGLRLTKTFLKWTKD